MSSRLRSSLTTTSKRLRTGTSRRSTSEHGSTFALVDSPVRFGGQPNARSRAPKHGEHTELALLEVGYDWGEITGPRTWGTVR